MSSSVVTRPETSFDGAAHAYHDAEGQRLLGVSSVAKIGEAEDSFSIGSAWGFRLGYEGAYELVGPQGPWGSPEQLRNELNAKGLTPWGTRDRAADRGNWNHDLLEALATDGTTPATEALAAVDEEYRGHGRAILQWYLDWRPSFVATEVQVTSIVHGFAGRYDIRCHLSVAKLIELCVELGVDPPSRVLELRRLGVEWALCLLDLKTSKRIYPTSHFPQLEGYETASVEMGFPETDVRIVLNTHPDGTYNLGVSYATGEDFVAYLGALRAIKRIKALDPEAKRKKAIEDAVLALLPALSRDIAGKPGVPETAKEVGRVLSGLKKRGLVSQRDDKIWVQGSS